jgi:PKD repeat protein
MDYTNGPCQNMFSIGQSQRMSATLASTLSGRNNLWSSANLIATGTDGTPAVTCTPHADFIPRPLFICEGTSLQFTDGSWGGPVDSRVWTFNGGTPATDTSANPTVLYATAGVYDVTLSVTNTAGTTSKTIAGKVVVSSSGNVSTPIGFTEGFENGTWPFNNYYAINANGGTTWQTTSLAANGGTKSIYISNTLNASTGYQSNDKGPDEFITPAFDFTNITNPTMSLDIACALRDTTTDRLAIYYSTNCGQTWTLRRAFQGLPLQTTTAFVTSNFIPNSSQWRNEIVTFGGTISNKPNVRFRIEFTHESANNIYLDNINLNGTVGLSEDLNIENAEMNIHPNPSKGLTYVDFSMLAQSNVKIDVLDLQGRIISTFSDNLGAGDHQYQINNNLESGVYLVRLAFGDRAITKKVVIR